MRRMAAVLAALWLLEAHTPRPAAAWTDTGHPVVAANWRERPRR